MFRKATVVASMASAALAVVVAGCGSSGTHSSTTAHASITRARASHIYLADVAPANVLATRLGQQFTSTTSNTQLAQDAKPFVAAAQKVDRRFALLARQYPPAAAALKAEVKADELLISGFQHPAKLTTRDLQDYISATQTAANAARARLGLPQHR